MLTDPCKEVSCSDEGACSFEGEEAVCECNTGFGAVGLECLPAPLVVSMLPNDGARSIGIEDPVEIVFSKAMNRQTLATGIEVTGPGDVAIAGDVTMSEDGKTARFSPNELFVEYESEYTVSLADTIVDRDGVAISATDFGFTTVLVDHNYWYKLETNYLGPEQVLDTSGLECSQEQVNPNAAGQSWRFTVINDIEFALSNSSEPTKYLEGGDGSGPCSLSDPVAQAPLQFFTGQTWTLSRQQGHPTNCSVPGGLPYFFLQNTFRGDNEALDTTNMSAIGCYSGQLWRPLRLSKIE